MHSIQQIGRTRVYSGELHFRPFRRFSVFYFLKFKYNENQLNELCSNLPFSSLLPSGSTKTEDEHPLGENCNENNSNIKNPEASTMSSFNQLFVMVMTLLMLVNQQEAVGFFGVLNNLLIINDFNNQNISNQNTNITISITNSKIHIDSSVSKIPDASTNLNLTGNRSPERIFVKLHQALGSLFGLKATPTTLTPETTTPTTTPETTTPTPLETFEYEFPFSWRMIFKPNSFRIEIRNGTFPGDALPISGEDEIEELGEGAKNDSIV